MTATETARIESGSAGEPDDYGLPAEPSWREVDWPSQVRRLTIDDASVAYVDDGAGAGPPLVLIHGHGGRWRNWLENIPALSRDRRVVALDLPGFGDSEMPVEDISISGYARVVDRLCERLGLGPVAMAGNSMGGFVAAELAVAFPERVEHLVLVDARRDGARRPRSRRAADPRRPLARPRRHRAHPVGRASADLEPVAARVSGRRRVRCRGRAASRRTKRSAHPPRSPAPARAAPAGAPG